MKHQLQETAEAGAVPARVLRSAELPSLWEQLHPVPPAIGHPIPRLNRAFIPPVTCAAGQRLNRLMARITRGIESRARAFDRLGARRAAGALLLLVPLLGMTGCTVLSYTSATGERFSRGSFGANTSIASLSVATGTNGLRQIELRGYQNESTQALATVTEAAVRTALQGGR